MSSALTRSEKLISCSHFDITCILCSFWLISFHEKFATLQAKSCHLLAALGSLAGLRHQAHFIPISISVLFSFPINDKKVPHATVGSIHLRRNTHGTEADSFLRTRQGSVVSIASVPVSSHWVGESRVVPLAAVCFLTRGVSWDGVVKKGLGWSL
jgi:hypothetical protein